MSSPSPGLRVLFCSYHSYLDLSSGAAVQTRDLLEMLAARGWACGALCGPRFDFPRPGAVAHAVAALGGAVEVARGSLHGVNFTVHHAFVGGVPVTGFDPDGGPAGNQPGEAEGRAFLDLFRGVADRFRPDVLLTYGGQRVAREVLAEARRRGIRVVFALHNFAYHDAALFRDTDAVLVPSSTAADHYRQKLGLECTAIPGPWDWGRILCPRIDGRFVTFVNPSPEKGVFLFARLAAEMGRRRSDVPFLVIEGRGGTGWLGRTGVDLTGLTNVHLMGTTPDPCDFYRVSRLVLVPSAWRENFARVPVEALINGIPVLASRRGALPEVLAEGGLLFDVPDWYTEHARVAPSAEDVAPWVEAIERLWDDPEHYEQERRRCRSAAETWRPERLLPRLEAFFIEVAAGKAGPRPAT